MSCCNLFFLLPIFLSFFFNCWVFSFLSFFLKLKLQITSPKKILGAKNIDTFIFTLMMANTLSLFFPHFFPTFFPLLPCPPLACLQYLPCQVIISLIPNTWYRLTCNIFQFSLLSISFFFCGWGWGRWGLVGGEGVEVGVRGGGTSHPSCWVEF